MNNRFKKRGHDEWWTWLFLSLGMKYNTVVSLLRDHPHIQQRVVSQKKWSSTRCGRGNGLDQFLIMSKMYVHVHVFKKSIKYWRIVINKYSQLF